MPLSALLLKEGESRRILWNFPFNWITDDAPLCCLGTSPYCNIVPNHESQFGTRSSWVPTGREDCSFFVCIRRSRASKPCGLGAILSTPSTSSGVGSPRAMNSRYWKANLDHILKTITGGSISRQFVAYKKAAFMRILLILEEG
jgi:hypothetical protein